MNKRILDHGSNRGKKLKKKNKTSKEGGMGLVRVKGKARSKRT